MAAPWPFGEYPEGGLEELGPHVTAYYGDAFPVSSSAIVRGTEATLVFDANTLRFARALRTAVDERPSPPLTDLVLSHTHGDHTHGAMYFAPSRVWARPYTQERLAFWAEHDLSPFVEEYREHYPGAEQEFASIRIVVPDSTVDEPETIGLGGGVTVSLYPEGTAHTPGDLWALVEPDGVALCGDLWFNDSEPYLGNGSIEGSLRAIEHLRDAEAHVYLPGHGRAGPLAPPGLDMMERFCAWLRASVDAHAAAGLSRDELLKAVRSEFEGQKTASDDPIAFSLEIPGFLEDGAEQALTPAE